MTSSALDHFGKFFVENFRDKAIEQHEMLIRGKLKAPSVQSIQAWVLSLSSDDRSTLSRLVVDAIDTAMHDFLFSLQDAHDREMGIEVIVDGENIASVSGMLNGEPLGENGWIKRFSKFSRDFGGG